ncbi:hypothetical protein A343_0295 [Porphyromonas gingivalis JCVI SC001]|nr:hypothetical protein A343_0295 [Porphyromonas gingivalis JCVI SC001]
MASIGVPYFDTIYKVWDAGLGVMFRAFRMRGGGFSWG